MLPPGAKFKRYAGRQRGHGSAVGEMTSLQAATSGPSGGVVVGLMESGCLGVALPCASAKSSRLLPVVFDGCSYVGRKLSPRDGAIIREINESTFALNFLETSSVGLSESCEKVVCSILSTDLASPALNLRHPVISDFRPPSVTESDEAAPRRLQASRAIGGYSLTSDDPAPGSPTVFHLSRVARPQDASKALRLGSLLSCSLGCVSTACASSELADMVT